MSYSPEDFDDAFAGLGPVGDGDDAADDNAADDGGDISPAPPFEGEGDPPLRRAAALPLNDYGNGQRFGIHFGADAMWVPRVGWFTWTGAVWEKDPDEIAVRRQAQQIGGLIGKELPWVVLKEWQMQSLLKERSLQADLAALANRDGGAPDAAAQDAISKIEDQLRAIAGLKKDLGVKRREHRSFARTSGNKSRIDAVLIEGGVGLAKPLDALDVPALDVNTLTGVMRFSVDRGHGYSATADMTLIPHARDQLLTKIMPVDYDPGASCPLFDAFMTRVQPDPAMRAYIQRWLGLSLTGLKVQKLAFWYGAGANGKSVLIDLIARMMGNYAATAKIESLTGKNKRGGGDATPDLMPLINARLVRASEPEEGERFQEGLIKELTGGEPILVRALHSDFLQVNPIFKLTISGNHKPEIRGTDDGIWRRLMLVLWDVQIPEKERDPLLGEKLWAERAGILNWLEAGLIAYLEGGLAEPAQVLAATQEFREESDPVGAFLTSCCHVSGDERDRITARDLGEAFNFWRGRIGENEWKLGSVARKLKEKSKRWKSPVTGRGFTEHKSSTMSYIGIGFVEPFGRDFRDAPRDQQGRILRSRSEGTHD